MGGNKTSANSLIEDQLHLRLRSVEEAFDADALTAIGNIVNPIDDLVRQAIEDRVDRGKSLAFILETQGGYIETAERIADVLRHYYERVEFVIPNFAMSAGTVLAMAGDAIHMDFFSVLGNRTQHGI